MWFLWFPLLITFMVVFGGFSLTSWTTEWIVNPMQSWLNSANWLPEWAAFISDVMYWLIWLIIRILLYFALAFLGGTIILICMAPVLTWLSERLAQEMGASRVEFNIFQLTRDITRAMRLAIKNGIIQIILTVACFALGFVPVLGAAAPFLLFAINSYYFGYNFMDYTLERKNLNIKSRDTFVWKNKWLALGLGTPFSLWMLIPFFGPMTSGFVAIFATVAATEQTEKRFDSMPTSAQMKQ